MSDGLPALQDQQEVLSGLWRWSIAVKCRIPRDGVQLGASHVYGRADRGSRGTAPLRPLLVHIFENGRLSPPGRFSFQKGVHCRTLPVTCEPREHREIVDN